MKFPKKWMLGAFVMVVLVAGGICVSQVVAASDKPAAKTETKAVDKPAAKADDKKEEKSDKKAAETAPQDKAAWIVRCDDLKEGEKVVGKYCEAVQSLSVSEKDADPSTAKRLIEIAIGYPPVLEGKASGVVILPLGIAVNEEIAMLVDGDKLLKADIRYCDPKGCYGIFELSNGDLNKMGKGKELLVKSKLFNGQPLDVTLSLNGIGKAFEEIKPKKAD